MDKIEDILISRRDKLKRVNNPLKFLVTFVVLVFALTAGLSLFFAFNKKTDVNMTFNINIGQTIGGIIVPENEEIPTDIKIINKGENKTFNIIPDDGYYATKLIIDGKEYNVTNYGNSFTYVFEDINSEHTITATFEEKLFSRITVNQGENGTITPSSISLDYGTTQEFLITPNEGYEITSIVIDGQMIPVTVSSGAPQTYIFENLQEDHTISATFAIRVFAITVNQPENGTISPSTVVKNYGETQTFTITPNLGYKITGLYIDGRYEQITAEEGESQTYTFEDITFAHTITAIFEIRTFGIDVIQSENGTIAPASVEDQEWGSRPSFIIAPNDAYRIDKILINGVEVEVTVAQGASQTYTFESIENYSIITAVFALKQFTVTYLDWDDSIIQVNEEDSQIIEYGNNAIVPAEPIREGYRFDCWDKLSDNVTEDLIIKAEYVKQFTVTFKDWDGDILSEQLLDINSDAIAPANPTRENHRFTGWDRSFTNITENLTITAQYIEQFQIDVIQTENGEISPETILVDKGSHQSFTITPEYSYKLEAIIINGVEQLVENNKGEVYTYTFENVENINTISALFSEREFGVKVTQTKNGRIEAENRSLNLGGDQTFVITPNLGYKITEILVDGIAQDIIVGEGESQTYTFTNIQDTNNTITATFEIRIFTITFVGPNDEVINIQTIEYGKDATAPVHPSKIGYRPDGWDNEFTNVTSDLIITAQYFEQFTITVNTTINGRIAPSTSIIDKNTNKSFVITPNLGYKISSIIIDAGTEKELLVEVTASEGDSQIYTFENITSDHSITVNFEIIVFPVEKEHGENGLISGDEIVEYGSEKTYTIIPNIGYKITEILVDGIAQDIIVGEGESQTYTFTNITSEHSISATFEIRTFEITVEQSENGVISPETIVKEYGENESFKITPNDNYKIVEILVNGTPIEITAIDGEAQTFTFENISSTQTVTATFAIITFEVQFKDWDNSIIQVNGENSQTIEYGNNAIVPADPVREGYRFLGWDIEANNITENLIITAQYIEQFIVTFVDQDGITVIPVNGQDTQKVDKGEIAIAPADPVAPEGCRFTGWDLNFSNVTEDITVTAQYVKIFNIEIEIIEKGMGTVTSNYENFDGYVYIDSDITFTIKPYTGYKIKSIIIDIGTENEQSIAITLAEGSPQTHTFENIQEEHSIKVTFEKITFNININQVLGATITGPTTVEYDSNATYEIVANPGYKITYIILNGNYIKLERYIAFHVIRNIKSNYSISIITTLEWEYTIKDGSYYLTSVPSGFGTLNIPSNLETEEGVILISGLGNNLRSINGLSNYSKIIIPKSIKDISQYAFTGCINLELIEFEENSQLTSIGWGAFKNCSNLKEIIFGENSKLKSIENSVFSNCTSLTSITIPEGVTSIGSEAFWACFKLNNIVFKNEDNLIKIGRHAFHHAPWYMKKPDGYIYIGNILYSLKNINPTTIEVKEGTISITEGVWPESDFYGESFSNVVNIKIPSTIVYIPKIGNLNCKDLKAIEVHPDNQAYSSENGVLFNKNKTILIDYPAMKDNETYIVPNTVTSIKEYAFSGCTNLKRIIFEENSQINNIDSKTFSDCKNLTSITIPDSVTSIESAAFRSCSNLTSITIPSSVTSIGNSTFSGCVSLTSITIPDSVTSIGDSTFSGCVSLTSITIPNSVTSIGDCAFYNCTSLISIIIPNSVENIEWNAFENCTSLTSITIPNSVTSIGSEAFQNCTNLKSIIFKTNSQLTSIGGYAFENCSKLELITIPNSVTSIGDYAFYGCGSLVLLFEENSKIEYLSDSMFEGLQVISLPKSGIRFILKKNNNPAHIILYPSWYQYQYQYNDKVEVYTDEEIGNKIIKIDSLGNVFLTNETSVKILLSYYRNETNVIIPEGVTSIGKGAFSWCRNLTSITIPNTVKSIGDRAFYDCTSLTSITIPEGVTSIGNGAFYWCRNLTSIIIPSSVTSIGYEAFYTCWNLTSVTIPEGVTSIEYAAFQNCIDLTSIIFKTNSQLTSIGYYAFENCTSLKSITIPSGVTSIEYRAFYGCRSLTSIIIPKKVTSIANSAFAYCSKLKSVTFEEGSLLEYLYDNNAFSNCSELTSITFGSQLRGMGFGSFNFCPKLTSITIKSIIPPTFYQQGNGFNVLYNSGLKLYVPSTRLNIYKTTSEWLNFANKIYPIP